MKSCRTIFRNVFHDDISYHVRVDEGTCYFYVTLSRAGFNPSEFYSCRVPKLNNSVSSAIQFALKSLV